MDPDENYNSDPEKAIQIHHSGDGKKGLEIKWIKIFETTAVSNNPITVDLFQKIKMQNRKKLLPFGQYVKKDIFFIITFSQS